MLKLFILRVQLLQEQFRIRSAIGIGRHTGGYLPVCSVLSESSGDNVDTLEEYGCAKPIYHTRLRMDGWKIKNIGDGFIIGRMPSGPAVENSA